MVEAYIPGVGHITDISAYLKQRQSGGEVVAAGMAPQVPEYPSDLEVAIKELEDAIAKLEESNSEIEKILMENGPDEILSETLVINVSALQLKRERLEACRDRLASNPAEYNFK